MSRPPTEASKSIDTISKVLAVLLLFIGLPCYAGIVADRSFGTSWMTPLAAVLGTFMALAGLLLVMKKMELEEPKGAIPKYRSAEELEEEDRRWRASQDSDGETADRS